VGKGDLEQHGRLMKEANSQRPNPGFLFSHQGPPLLAEAPCNQSSQFFFHFFSFFGERRLHTEICKMGEAENRESENCCR